MRPLSLKLACAAMLVSEFAVAQPALQTEGRAIAEKVCRQCHEIEPGSAASKSNAPPAFASIAAMPSTTALSLKVFLRTPHGEMPDIILSDTEINAVSDYILALRK